MGSCARTPEKEPGLPHLQPWNRRPETKSFLQTPNPRQPGPLWEQHSPIPNPGGVGMKNSCVKDPFPNVPIPGPALALRGPSAGLSRDRRSAREDMAPGEESIH